MTTYTLTKLRAQRAILQEVAKEYSGRSHGWHTEHSYERDIEYVRNDAFIEKACVKLKKLMYDNLMFQGRLHREEVINNFVEDFKKYMEQ